MQPPEKHLVSQTRLLWTFSLAARLGYGEECLEAAEHGYRFLLDRLLDREHGGFYWRVDLEGNVIDQRKALYGQAFAVYALAEHHRATRSGESLALACQTFRLVNDRLREPGGGWREHGERDFAPLRECPARVAPVDRAAMQSANGHVHWMEALSELLEITDEADVRTALVEAIEVCRTFFPLDPALCAPFRTPNGTLIEAGTVNFGHNLEFAWLMVRAQQVLGEQPDWERFDALTRHALARAFDQRRGGFGDHGDASHRFGSRRKVWWVQAEGLIALIIGLSRGPAPDYERALSLLVDWIDGHQRAPDGVWIDAVSDSGGVLWPVKAGNWKAAYHELRAGMMLIDSFGENGGARGPWPAAAPAS